jgi:hypothetical protein
MVMFGSTQPGGYCGGVIGTPRFTEYRDVDQFGQLFL